MTRHGSDTEMQGDPRGDDAGGSILNRLSGRSVRCYQCGEWFRAAVRAETASCTNCYRQVNVQDITIRESFWGSSLMSAGRITVLRKGVVRAKLVVACHGIKVFGRVEGQILCGGPVFLGRDAVFKGSIAAMALEVEDGAVIESADFAVPQNPIGTIELPRAGAGRVISGPAAAISGPA
jgi:hypothetical protein